MAQFPDIHWIDPSPVTKAKVFRMFFFTKHSFLSFCEGKEVRYVLRNPYQRYLSFYRGVVSGVNTLYKYPYHLGGQGQLAKQLSCRQMLAFTAVVPDRVADRHFRSQTFGMKELLQQRIDVQVFDMKPFLSRTSVVEVTQTNNIDPSPKRLILNAGPVLVADKLGCPADDYFLFKFRYKQDIMTYQALST